MSEFGENRNDDPDSVLKQSPGLKLRRAREACELSRVEIAKHLKLSVEKIECLENNDVESIAAPVFVAGYLRSYSKLVNLSGDEIVAEFKELAAMKSPSMDPASSPAANDYGQVGNTSSLNITLGGNHGLGGVLISGTIVVLLVIGGYIYFSGADIDSLSEIEKIKDVGEINSEDSSAKGNELIKIATAENGLETLSPDKKVRSETIIKEKVNTPVVSGINTGTKEGTNITDTIGARSSDVINSSELSELIFYFTEDSWVDVKDSRDKRLLYRIGKAGRSHTIVGLAPFNAHLGFVNGVNIVYNGESYDLSRFENRRSARFSIGREGDRLNVSE